MRIIAGELKSREFKSPGGHRTHPMGDKVRGGMFNTLGELSGLTVLDPFGGSGALSFEAVSRGASHALVIERDKAAQRTIQDNIATLRLEDKVKLVRAGANSWLGTADGYFDLVLLDPPYDDLQPKLLVKLAERAKLGSLVVVSLPPAAEFEPGEHFGQLAAHSYGDAQLVFYRRIS